MNEHLHCFGHVAVAADAVGGVKPWLGKIVTGLKRFR